MKKGYYKCECGKEFDNPQKFNGHKSNCIIHLKAIGKYEYYLKRRELNYKHTSETRKKKSKEKREDNLNKWISEKHICEHCGKVMTEKFGSGRFCCKSCANSRSKDNFLKEKVSNSLKNYFKKNNINKKDNISRKTYDNNPNYCVICGKKLSFERKYARTCSRKCFKILCKNNALDKELGGFNMHRIKHTVDGKIVDSTYEKILAEDLTKNNIKWTRCNRFKYVDNKGKLHYYTPDFYLPDYDIYLDPKNDYLINNINPILGYRDVDKIRWVEEQNNIKIIILDKDNLNFESILYIINKPM